MAQIGSGLSVLSSRQCTGARTGCVVQDADWNSQIFHFMAEHGRFALLYRTWSAESIVQVLVFGCSAKFNWAERVDPLTGRWDVAPSATVDWLHRGCVDSASHFSAGGRMNQSPNDAHAGANFIPKRTD
jgi:hypothetical protein